MNDDELLRYSRHILLDAVGVEGQQQALNAHALIIGAGGLGSPVAMYLAASGVGKITLVDDDRVELTNLQRQIAHTQERLGWPKVDSAREAMRALNPGVEVQTQVQRADRAEDRVDEAVDAEAVGGAWGRFGEEGGGAGLDPVEVERGLRRVAL